MDFSLRSPMKHGGGFGLPSPSVSEAVLKEMNDRAAQLVTQTQTSPTKSSAALAASYRTSNTPSGRSSRASTTRFGRAHQRTFKNMDSISHHYAANRDRDRARTEAVSASEPARLEIYDDATTPETANSKSGQRDVVSSAAKRRRINIFGRKLELGHSPAKENISPAKELAAKRSPVKLSQENSSPVKLGHLSQKKTQELMSPVKMEPVQSLESLESSSPIRSKVQEEFKEPSKTSSATRPPPPTTATTTASTSGTTTTRQVSNPGLRHMKSKTNMSRPPTRPVGFSLSTDRRADRTMPPSSGGTGARSVSDRTLSHSQSTRSIRGAAAASQPTLSPSKSTPSLAGAASSSSRIPRGPSVRMPPLSGIRKTSASEPSSSGSSISGTAGAPGTTAAPSPLTKSSTMSNLQAARRPWR